MKLRKISVGIAVISFFMFFNTSFVEGQSPSPPANLDNPLDKANDKTNTKPPNSLTETKNETSDASTKMTDATSSTEADNQNDDIAASFSPTPIVTITPATETEIATLEKIVKDWTTAFNKKDLNATCGLFAKNVTADYRGLPPKDHAAICNGFRKVFADRSHRYEYRYKIHKIYRLNDLAVIRITWYLHTFRDGQEISMIQDEGMDVLSKNDKDQWKIINYLAYQK